MMTFLKSLKSKWGALRKHANVSYAQCGEDLLLHFLLVELLKIKQPAYLDIGAHDPIRFSNTYFLYLMGGRGVCVEPDPDLLARIKQVRPKDTCLNVGIGAGDEKAAEFFVMSEQSLNTFSRVNAERLAATGNHRIERILRIPLVAVNQVLADNFSTPPNLVSLDTEGNDLEILRSFNFGEPRPEVFCVETLTFPEERRVVEIVDLMQQRGYSIYADTYLNTIFVDETAWAKRGMRESLRIRMAS